MPSDAVAAHDAVVDKDAAKAASKRIALGGAACSARAKRKWPPARMGSLGAVLALAVSILVAVGMATAPYLITAIAPGFEGERRELTIAIARVMFPCTGLLVMSAWCLGMFNSHHKFFMLYAAPVAFNVAMIAALLIYGPHHSQDALAIDLAWGAVAGAALQIVAQLPQTLTLLRRLRLDFAKVAESLRAVFRNLGPGCSRAASASSAPTSTTSSQAGCRSAPYRHSTKGRFFTCCR
jgi:peptidoglycan biosynthesis protein MviN/MurJ (putative lipid II flippase)